MMKPVLRVDGSNASAVDGTARLDVKKAVWNWSMIGGAVFLGPLTFGWGAVLTCCLLTYFSLLIGHSAGMHRMMIHKTYQCPKLLERTLIYIGVLVGMAGPFGILGIHDLRDWAQRQKECHDFFAHRRSYFKDVFWQLTCSFEFAHPPRFTIEDELAGDRWYQFLEATWRFHQLIVAVPLYSFGGWAWVVWGICARVSISVVGHWTITYFCHNPGPGKWGVKGASVQASNIPGIGFLTHGECWHNNHHAFPESARIGLERGQTDLSWVFISWLGKIGWATNIGLPRPFDQREDLLAIRSA
jgi:stearoyl-CoA desaturase (delta-9 desaturase)